jgi:hypothetical protein
MIMKKFFAFVKFAEAMVVLGVLWAPCRKQRREMQHMGQSAALIFTCCASHSDS